MTAIGFGVQGTIRNGNLVGLLRKDEGMVVCECAESAVRENHLGIGVNMCEYYVV